MKAYAKHGEVLTQEDADKLRSSTETLCRLLTYLCASVPPTHRDRFNETLKKSLRETYFLLDRIVGPALKTKEPEKAIRVLRLIEYVYTDVETMAQDMSRWNVQSEYLVRNGTRIKSVTLPLEVLDAKPRKCKKRFKRDVLVGPNTPPDGAPCVLDEDHEGDCVPPGDPK